jgi:hypothetical protein
MTIPRFYFRDEGEEFVNLVAEDNDLLTPEQAAAWALIEIARSLANVDARLERIGDALFAIENRLRGLKDQL